MRKTCVFKILGCRIVIRFSAQEHGLNAAFLAVHNISQCAKLAAPLAHVIFAHDHLFLITCSRRMTGHALLDLVQCNEHFVDCLQCSEVQFLC